MPPEARVHEMLLTAAKAGFLEYGYRKASFRSFAQAAEVSTGSVYYFFGSKKALFHAIVDEAAAVLHAQLHGAYGASQGALLLTEIMTRGHISIANTIMDGLGHGEFLLKRPHEACEKIRRTLG